MFLGNIISLASGKPLFEFFGQSGCFIFRSAMVMFSYATYISSFCMALFRYSMINCPTRVQKMGMNKFKQFITIFEIVLYIWGGLWSAAVYISTSSPFTMVFCKDQSLIFLQTMNEHRLDDGVDVKFKFGVFIISVFIQFLGICEFIMYFQMFKTLRNKDEILKKNIGKEMYQKRTKRNVISLTGQAFGFGIELIAMITLHLMIQLDLESVFFQPQMVSFYTIVASTLISISQFITSSDMRRFYLKTEV